MIQSDIKWQAIVKAKSSIFFQWCVFEGHKEKWFQKSLNLRTGLTNGKIVSDEIFIDLNEWIKLEGLLTSEVKKDENFLKNFIDLCYRYSNRLIEASKQIGQTEGWHELENNQLLFLYEKYQDSVLRLMPFLNAILVLDNVLKKEILNLFESELGVKDEKEQNLLISKLVIPQKKSFFVQETEVLLKIALKLQKNKKADVGRDIQKYLEKYAWMTSIAFLGEFQTKEGVMEKVDELLKEDIDERLKHAERIKKEALEDYKKTLNRIKKSQRVVELIKLAQEFIYLQTYRFDVFSLAHFHARPLLESIGKRFDLQVEELIYLTGDEIRDLLRDEVKVNKQEVKNRIDNFALILENNKYTLLSGNQVKKIVQKVIEKITVEGIVANRGRATGKAKLVNEVKDIPKVNRGDILVSPMTHPKLVPAIVKASGIITDFGGILCHAAIVSREFGIPCIVDTKNATRVFKDGDLVELNAYEGTARKL